MSESMRLHCYFCGKSVSTEVPTTTILRALCACPECIEAGKVSFPAGVATKTPPDPLREALNGAIRTLGKCGRNFFEQSRNTLLTNVLLGGRLEDEVIKPHKLKE